MLDEGKRLPSHHSEFTPRLSKKKKKTLLLSESKLRIPVRSPAAKLNELRRLVYSVNKTKTCLEHAFEEMIILFDLQSNSVTCLSRRTSYHF